MTKREFKGSLEELLWDYLRENINSKPIVDRIDFYYSVDEECGELVFRTDKKDFLFKIPKIDLKD